MRGMRFTMEKMAQSIREQLNRETATLITIILLTIGKEALSTEQMIIIERTLREGKLLLTKVPPF